MKEFLKSMYAFVENTHSFDARNYSQMFGVFPPGGAIYWPSCYYRELTDDLIIGHGLRPMATKIEASIDHAEQQISG